MIYESSYWKDELYYSFRTIAEFRKIKSFDNESIVQLEKAMMFGAYIIRKLHEAEKIPPDFLERKEVLTFYETNTVIVDHMNWHRIETLYKEKEKTTSKDWRFIINQIIHSFTFCPTFVNNEINGFLVNSDKIKNKALFFLPIELIFKIFLSISEGGIVLTNSSRDILGEKENGEKIYGEMRLRSALYSYPEDFNLEKEINNTLNGKIYIRNK